MRNNMKRFAILCCIIIAIGILTGCAKNKITIDEMSQGFTAIEITDGSTGAIMTLDEKQSRELYGKLKDIDFIKGDSTKDTDEWRYSLRFLRYSTEIDRFVIQDSDTIIYNGYLRDTEDQKIDMDYLMSIFYQVFDAEIMETGDSILVAPDQSSEVYRSSDRIAVSLLNTEIIDQMGKTIDATQLNPGDILRIAFNGVIAESYPAQITAIRVQRIDRDILLDGYMALINDIYQEDIGLNGDITMIAFDTMGWIEVTDTQKEIILSMVHNKYGLEVLEGTYAELVEQELIDGENLYFEFGVLIEMKDMSYDPNKKVLEAVMSKWRGGIGAIGWNGKAKLDGTEWKVTRTKQWIS